MKVKILVATVLAFCILHSAPQLRAQGTLTPPGAPAPMMKSLAQIEPRTPISGTPFSITNGGSYYLTTNLYNSFGITISASDVTIDLNGFTFSGFSGSGIGIYGPSTMTNITIRDGTIKSFSADGIYLPSTRNCRLEDLIVAKNGSNGATVGDDALVGRCGFIENQGVGLKGGHQCVINGCNVAANTGGGIVVSNYCTIQGSTASLNTGTNGITTGDGCVVSGCAASQNFGSGISTGSGGVIKDCAADLNVAHGIVADRATISGCTAWSNNGDGIRSATSSLITGNACRANVANEIHVTDTLNRIDGNSATGIIAGSGTIRVDVAGNFIVRNSAQGYNTNGTIQTIGPIITTTGTISTNNPWANFQL